MPPRKKVNKSRASRGEPIDASVRLITSVRAGKDVRGAAYYAARPGLARALAGAGVPASAAAALLAPEGGLFLLVVTLGAARVAGLVGALEESGRLIRAAEKGRLVDAATGRRLSASRTAGVVAGTLALGDARAVAISVNVARVVVAGIMGRRVSSLREIADVRSFTALQERVGRYKILPPKA